MKSTGSGWFVRHRKALILIGNVIADVAVVFLLISWWDWLSKNPYVLGTLLFVVGFVVLLALAGWFSSAATKTAWGKVVAWLKRRHTALWGIGAGLAIAVGIIALVYYWDWSIVNHEALRNIGLVVAGFLGLFMLLSRAWSAHKAAKAANDQATTAQQGHFTDRFTKAVEQLANDDMAIRLGGIYALERLAKDSKRDHWTIMEVLTAYVREKSKPIIEEVSKHEDEEDFDYPAIDTDIQAIMTVIGRRELKHEEGITDRLDLNNTYLEAISKPGSRDIR